MKPKVLEKFSKEDLIRMLSKKDEMIDNLIKIVEEQQYLGRLFIDGKWYCFYAKEEKEI